jgi:hypothetical protein
MLLKTMRLFTESYQEKASRFMIQAKQHNSTSVRTGRMIPLGIAVNKRVRKVE